MKNKLNGNCETTDLTGCVRGVEGSQMSCMCRDTKTHELVLATVDLSKPFTRYIPVWA